MMAKKTKRQGKKAKTSKRAVGSRAAGARPAAKKAAGRMPTRADLGADVSLYWKQLEAANRSVAKQLHALVMEAAPRAKAAIKWGMPVYEHHGKLCYIWAHANYVTLGFYAQGTSLDDPDGLLEGTGRNMRHVKLGLSDEVPAAYLKALVKQAARLNEADAGQ